MSTTVTAPTQIAAQLVATRDIWDDTSTELNDQRLKKSIPPLPRVTIECQTVCGNGIEKVAYLALQVIKTRDKKTTVRAIASACSILLRDNGNFTGSPMKSVELKGLEIAEDEKADEATVLKTNFEDAEEVTIGELLKAMDVDGDELGAYFGVLFTAGNKRVNRKNQSAFNDKRKNAATASIVGEAKIFVPDSPYLDTEVLDRVYASFISYSPLRANMTHRVLGHLEEPLMGPSLAFTSLFLLLVDSGMSALKIIKEAVLKHPWILTDFPELKPELAAANDAQNTLKKAPGRERSFLKAIHGNNFVPVNYSQIDNLTGVCKEILKRTTPSYQNYDGGKITESQLQRINARVDVKATLIDTVAAE